MSRHEHDEFDELVAVYAVGALDGDDLVRFEAHLAVGCPACEAALREADEALARLAVDRPRAIPPAHVKEALVARLAATAPHPRPATRRWLPWAAGVAAAMLVAALLGAGFTATYYEQRLGIAARETAALRNRMAAQDKALREELRLYAGAVELLRDPRTQVVALHGTGPNPEAIGRVVWNEAAGGQLFVANLPAPPAGKTYELWKITGATPVAAGVFTTDSAGKAIHEVGPAGKVDVFAVTLEPAGGVPAPTGPIVLASAK
ncbi:MAG: anti-sigma factor [Candidatus Rokubacteria bacterium]|nr:anti-sigma factor [Candidatus Rokubacteria bacterium]